MVSLPTPDAIAGTTIAFSFILLGNAITQSFMGVPALLIDFPRPSSPEHPRAARLLGRQWPVFWQVGNVFFRPISTLGILGYGYTAFSAWRYASAMAAENGWHTALVPAHGQVERGNWKIWGVCALCHLVTVVHSALNMQPLNAKLEGLSAVEVVDGGNKRTDGVVEGAGSKGKGGVDVSLAEYYARRWIKLNLVRALMPLVAGSLGLWQSLGAKEVPVKGVIV
ncbi:uncharacterized protein PODANS_4_5320 [Podospora anserina S mat+]|uniref:Podospora anserina S mat+ genomic DNA chromosome 4, supercontig 4 n=1 Tax=Podospora anserina (strain S / ATCC MYA-4624 / DSM 980 / FGSC 10383) TaxID=515849 RepID=B2AQ51_PODAN|nr:uncharacterized protein PODANS_4_5320 [Podospora anserina S mat+]CAP66990.1 unnamed protein product [Podospora anserina S mat+]CDP28732.1 Putative protein of unknown function [Podospora anserina S mat+]